MVKTSAVSPAVFCAVLVACSGGGSGEAGGDRGPDGDQDLGGGYPIVETITASTCPTMPVGATANTLLSIQPSGSEYDVLLLNVSDGCGALLQRETFTATGCGGELRTDAGLLEVSDAGRIEIFTWQMQATVNGPTISGTLEFQDSDPPPSCQFTETFTGTRQ